MDWEKCREYVKKALLIEWIVLCVWCYFWIFCQMILLFSLDVLGDFVATIFESIRVVMIWSPVVALLTSLGGLGVELIKEA